MKNKSLKVTILILFFVLITKIFLHFKALYNFQYYPLGDITNHMSNLYFLALYGFHQLVPHWYNGFILFESYFPGFFYFALPFYLLTKNIITTTIISIILIYVLGFIFIYLFGKTQKLSILKTIAIYLLFFANPLLIIYLTLGRLPELFAWILPFLTLILYYKDHKLNKISILFIPVYSLILMTHIYVTLIASLLFIPLFLIKGLKEKIMLIIYALISLLISSFVWLSFIKVLEKPLGDLFNPLNELLTRGSIISYNTFFLISFFIIIFFYLKNKDKKEKIFFSPIIIIAVLLLTRIAVFIPLLNKIPPNTYNVFFLLINLILLFKTNLFKIIPLVIAILTIFVVVQQPFLSLSVEKKGLIDDVIGILPKVEDKFIILSNDPSLTQSNVMSYAIINYNLSTPNGENPPVARKEFLEKGLLQDINFFTINFKEDCFLLNSSLENLETKEVISHDNYCKFLENCNLKKIAENKRACLYKKI